jgi:two-component system OmpR family response regulator
MAKRILVVEDDQLTRDFYVDLLTQEGYQVETAPDGRKGLEKILEGGYDLILLDIIMPKLDGLGVLKKLQKKKPKSPNGPIVILTVVSQAPIAKRTRDLGAADYLIKTTTTPNHLIKKLRSYLGRQLENNNFLTT